VLAFDVVPDGLSGDGSSSGYCFVFGGWFAFESISTNLISVFGNGIDSYLYLKNVVTGEELPSLVTAAGTPSASTVRSTLMPEDQTIYTTSSSSAASDDNGPADPNLNDRGADAPLRILALALLAVVRHARRVQFQCLIGFQQAIDSIAIRIAFFCAPERSGEGQKNQIVR
jgi:hypothetical protein